MNLLQKAQMLRANEEDPRQRVLIYGDSGTGKSTLAAQLASQYKLHWFDFDSGSEVLFTAIPQQYWHNIDVYTVADLPENPRAAKLADRVVRPDTATTFCSAHGAIAQRNNLGQIAATTCTLCGKDASKYVTFDTSKLTTNDIIVLDGGVAISNSASNYSVGSEIMSKDMAAIKLEHDHHGKQGKILENIITRMKSLPCHVIMITHPVAVENKNKTIDIVPAFGTRNFAKPTRAAFGHIVYLYMKNGKHCFTSSETHQIGVCAKSRWNVDVQKKEDIFKLFQLGILQAAPTEVKFETDPEGPDETQRESGEGSVVEAEVQVQLEVKAPVSPAAALAERLREAQLKKQQ